jgi:hypothetical protein
MEQKKIRSLHYSLGMFDYITEKYIYHERINVTYSMSKVEHYKRVTKNV